MCPAVLRGVNFNSRPSARGDEETAFRTVPAEYFNSRPSARGDGIPPIRRLAKFSISIHAPPRGATRSFPAAVSSRSQFQFTPLREGRPDQHHQPTSTISHFNSRPSARGDDLRRGGDLYPRHFNSRPSARGDLNPPPPCAAVPLFQFTPLREGRRQRPAEPPAASRFQFTPLREGRPAAAAASSACHSISIHAPPRGATTPKKVVS